MKLVIVTGDSGGLGSSIVETLLSSDEYRILGISRRENAVTEKLKDMFGERYSHINFDLAQPENIKELYSSCLKKYGAVVYGLVNNSAYAYDDIVTNANIQLLDVMYKVNVLSPIMLTKFVIRDMLLNGVTGSIVHVTSVSAHTGYKGLSMYASTKGALESFSKGVAREWGEIGIRSNCVAPGFMETAMSETLSGEQKGRIYKRTSLKKATETSSVAHMVEFLLSDKSISVTGTVMRVDCGT